MELIRPSEVAPQGDSNPLFIGSVTRQVLVGSSNSNDYTMALINFAPGARNKFHRHTHDQVLIVTHGVGIVATDDRQMEVHEGELILVTAGEKHWHGATPASAFSHISLTAAGSTTETLE